MKLDGTIPGVLTIKTMYSESETYFLRWLNEILFNLSKKAINLQQRYFILVSLVSENGKFPCFKKRVSY